MREESTVLPPLMKSSRLELSLQISRRSRWSRGQVLLSGRPVSQPVRVKVKARAAGSNSRAASPPWRVRRNGSSPAVGRMSSQKARWDSSLGRMGSPSRL